MAMAIRRSLEKVIRGIEGLTRTIERVAGRADYTGVSIGPKSQKPISQPSLHRWVRNTRNAQGRIGYQNSDALRSTRCQKTVDRHRGTRCNPLKQRRLKNRTYRKPRRIGPICRRRVQAVAQGTQIREDRGPCGILLRPYAGHARRPNPSRAGRNNYPGLLPPTKPSEISSVTGHHVVTIKLPRPFLGVQFVLESQDTGIASLHDRCRSIQQVAGTESRVKTKINAFPANYPGNLPRAHAVKAA